MKKGKNTLIVATMSMILTVLLPYSSMAQEQPSESEFETEIETDEVFEMESLESELEPETESEFASESTSDSAFEFESEFESQPESTTQGESVETSTFEEPVSEESTSEESATEIFTSEELTSEESTSEIQTQLIQYEDSVPLPQNGDFEAQYFGDQPSAIANEDAWQVVFKSRVQEAIKNNTTDIEIADLNLNRNTDLDQIRKVYRSCILGDCFFLSGGFSYSCTTDGVIKVFKAGYYSNYCDSYGKPNSEKIQADLAALYSEAAAAVDYASVARSQLEAALLLHDWLVRECDYAYQEYLNHALPKSVYNAYGALVNGRAVCNGYALAYSYLLSKVGIDSYVLGSDAMNHAWNLLCIDGIWYHADLTSDDPVFTGNKTYLEFYNDDYSDEGFVYHKYFLKSDEEISALGHRGWTPQSSMDELPAADKSGVYSTALFADDIPGDYSLIQGKWYFCKNGTLYSSNDLWGSNLKAVSSVTVKAYYSHMQNGLLYFTDFARVYVWNPRNPYSWEMAASASVISELSIKKGQLVFVTLSDTQSEKHIEALNIRFLPEPPVLRQIPYTAKVKLAWTEVPSADGYVIEYKSVNEDAYHTLKRIDASSIQSYSHIVKNSDAYEYRIRSFIQTGKTRAYSLYSSVITGFALPQKITGVSVKESTFSRLEISWNAISGADGYVIYEQTGSGSWKVIKKITNGMMQRYRTRAGEGEHRYSVRAFRLDENKMYYGERSQTVIFSKDL